MNRSPERGERDKEEILPLAVTNDAAIATNRTLSYQKFDQMPPKKSKKDIGRYIAEELKNNPEMAKILGVPRIFGSLEEILAISPENCQRFLIRSEDSQAYDGISDLLPTWSIYRDRNKGFEVRSVPDDTSRGFEKRDNLDSLLQDYRNTQIDTLGDNSNSIEYGFSLWEFVTGDNVTMVADTAIEGKYHIYFNGTNIGKKCIIVNLKDEHDHVDVIKKLVQCYEWVRTRSKFDSKNCPIMEFKLGSNSYGEVYLYFLQYLKTRDFNESNWEIEEQNLKDYIEVDFVRGATSQQGIEVMIFPFSQFSRGFSQAEKSDASLVGYCMETASGDFTQHARHIERLSTEAQVMCIGIHYGSLDGSDAIIDLCIEHLGRSILHKPQISVIFKGGVWVDNYQTLFGGEYGAKKFHLLSDGKRAFIKNID